eukprot:m.8934 g.8934  ORF g.8934 m.8934 type:complete len:274 (-) comp6779_c0_seq1:481-1302(-)
MESEKCDGATNSDKTDPWATQVVSMWRMTSRFAAQAVKKIPIVPGTRILDVAAGTGTAAILLAEKASHFADTRVVASDISPGMLTELRKLADEADVGGFVDTMEENAMALSASDATFDAVISVFGIPLVPDPPLAAAEVHRVLKQGGVAVIMWWEQVPTISMIRELVQVFGGEASEAESFESRFAVYDSGAKISALLSTAGLTVTSEDRVTLPFDLAGVAKEDPESLFANPIIGKHLQKIPQAQAHKELIKLCEKHASDWSEATASIVTAVKK